VTGQRFLGDSLGYWVGTIESGELDEKELWDDGSALVQVTLSREDLEIIEKALKRQFVSIKKQRTQVMHAVFTIRKALRL